MAARRQATKGRQGGKERPATSDQLTLTEWEDERRRPAASQPNPNVERLADALAPRIAAELSTRLRPPAAGPAATANLLTLDELVAQLPPAKRPQTWKRWLYERTRRGEVPGCVKLGGMLFFEREPALAWLRTGAASPR